MTTQNIRPDTGFVDRQLSLQRQRTRNRKIGAVAVAAILAALAIVALFVVSQPSDEAVGPAGRPTAPAINGETFPVDTGSGLVFVDLTTGVVTPLADGIPVSSSMSVSPDRTMIAYGPCCSASDPISISNIDGSGAREITPDNISGYGVQWSPDGTMLVYQGRKDGSTSELGELYVFDVATHETTQVTDLGDRLYDPWFLAPSFAPDGRSILFQMPRGPDQNARGWDLWTVPVDGGEPTLVRRDASFGSLAPDGTLAYLDPAPGDPSSDTLLVADVAGGDARVLVEGQGLWTPQWSPDGTRIAYLDDGDVHTVDATSGVTTNIADNVGGATWVDDGTLLVYR